MERLAFAYMNLDPWMLKVMAILAMVMGSLAYYLTRSAFPSISRLAYLCWLAVLLPLSALEALIWVYAPEAAANRLLSALVMCEIVLFILLGYAFGPVVAGRSNNAYGTPGRWWFAYLPIINLALFYSASREARQAGQKSLWLGGIGCVVAGLLVYGLTAQVQKISFGIVSTISAQEAAKKPAYTASVIRGGLDVRPLPDTLEKLVSQVKTPQRVDEATVLVYVGSHGDMLRYEYDVDSQAASLPPAIVERITSVFCHGALMPVIEAGASIKAMYRNSAKMLMAELEIDKGACRSLPSI